MNRKMVLFLAFGLIVSSFVLMNQSYAQGVVEHDSFFSEILNSQRDVDVYLPPQYDDDLTSTYPLIIFLHGASAVPSTYSNFATFLFNSSMENGTLQPAVIAFPDGSVEPYLGSFYTNSELYGDFEDYIIEDVFNYLLSEYRITPGQGSTAIIGHSMGGFGATKLAFKHPELFCAVASHSGPLDLAGAVDLAPIIYAENGSNGTYDPDAGVFSRLAFSMAGAFTPNLNNTPEPVDFILDENGDIIEERYNIWLTHSPSELAEDFAENPIPLFFDCGTSDELNIYSWNESFADSLESLGIDYTFESYAGGHANMLALRIPIGAAFINQYISNESSVQELSFIPDKIELLKSYPNPFNGSTNVSFNLHKQSFVKLSVYSIEGRIVETIVNTTFEPGSHILSWNADNLASGSYILRLQTGSQSLSSKIQLLR